MPFISILGFKKGADGSLEIDEDEAPTAHLIYQLVLEGLCLKQVKQKLEKRGLKTTKGKDVRSISFIRSILKNEKYKGDTLLQKTFTVGFLTKEKKRNEGEVPQCYVRNNHPTIVDVAIWDEVQYILKTTLSSARKFKQHFLSGRITCERCGGYFNSKMWHLTDKYRAVIWQCNHKHKGNKPCDNRHVTEEVIHQAFIEALNKLFEQYGSQKLFKEALSEVFDVNDVSQAIDEQK